MKTLQLIDVDAVGAMLAMLETAVNAPHLAHLSQAERDAAVDRGLLFMLQAGVHLHRGQLHLPARR